MSQFTITYRDGRGQLVRKTVTAAGEAEARAIFKHLFPGHRIENIRKA